MTNTSLRQKLHSYLEVAEDKKVKAIYTMMENEIEESLIEYTDELNKELDSRYTDFKNGKVKMVTAEESKKRIQKILKGGSKK